MIEFKNLQKVLNEYANEVKEMYQYRLNEGNSIASGELINSVRYILQRNDKAFEVSLSLLEYWKYVEYGRRAGAKFPPFPAIRKWIEIKPILPRPMSNGKLPTLNQLTYLISRKIAIDGIAPKNYLKKTLEEVNKEYDDKISEALTLDLMDVMDDAFALIVKR